MEDTSLQGVGWTIAASGAEESLGSIGQVPGNTWGAQAHGKYHRKHTAYVTMTGKGEKVR